MVDGETAKNISDQLDKMSDTRSTVIEFAEKLIREVPMITQAIGIKGARATEKFIKSLKVDCETAIGHCAFF
jgi:hypothetical protein